MSTSDRDNIFAQPIERVGQFQFDEKVAQVFSDMIQRSVPGYSTIIATSGLVGSQFAQSGSNIYDLGCSLGASLLAVAEHTKNVDCHLIGVDNSQAMLDRCKQHLSNYNLDKSVELICGDIADVKINNASVVLMNFTLQFIPIAKRLSILEQIYQGLTPGGCLILSEKVHFEDSDLNQLFTELHQDFKKSQGYTELEVSQKRTALEDVLIPEDQKTHLERLEKAGFERAAYWFQCYNFTSLVAIK